MAEEVAVTRQPSDIVGCDATSMRVSIMKTAKILVYAVFIWGIAFVAGAKELTPREQLGKNLFF